MIKQLGFFISFIFLSFASHADTTCATRTFADALATNIDNINESDDEIVIEQWVHGTFSDATVLRTVLDCPEIKNIPDNETIKFMPITYTFPGGREIVINYETQPKILKQRIMLANKRATPSSDPNPKIGDGSDAIWTNTDPAWYAIMVTQHGALDNFVGADKNNTISLDYIRDNIDDLYPAGYTCTSKSALATDDDAINVAVTKTVDMETQSGEEDTNDYYVAGDVNLQWISYAEIAFDVVLTVFTMGGWTVVSGVTKGARATRALNGLRQTMAALRATDSVRDYIRLTARAADLADQISKLDKVTDAAKIADLTRDLNRTNDSIRALENIDDVKKYKDGLNTYRELNAYRNSLKLYKNARRGNILVRTARATKSALSGNKLITHATKLGRSGTFSGRVRDWLFHSTLRNAGAVAKMGATGGVIYGAIRFVGNMYDWTETSTDEYTSGVEFLPLLLLSADDLRGQENVINHGMWLMWLGDSFSPADDDAAYLQAMDFASKFHEELTDEQKDTASPCDVDIYVVRPILRNPGSDDAGLYYLIMNDIPWTTHE